MAKKFSAAAESEPLRRAEEIERALGLPRGLLKQQRYQSNGPPFFQCGTRTLLYRIDQVQAWLESCARQSGEQPRRQAVG
jgi:hypothetical protein